MAEPTNHIEKLLEMVTGNDKKEAVIFRKYGELTPGDPNTRFGWVPLNEPTEKK